MARSMTTRSTNPKIMDDNIKILDDNLGKASAPDAEDAVYDNTDSGLTADNVQGAIDELSEDIYIGNISSVTENVISCGSDQTASYTTPVKGWYRAVIINTGGQDVSLRVNGKSFAYLNVQGRYEMIVPLASGVALTATVVGSGAIYLSKFNF